tara:strand:+ start:361 stop:1062 length:702 start_codon:yes stop_codon:yes gene_type:complete
MVKVKLKLDWANYKAAEYSCKNWHYSKCLPIGKSVKVGVWENNKFIGVVLFSRGTAPTLGKKYGLVQTECVELTRIALTNHISPVSRIMAIALKFLQKSNKGIRLVVSFAAKSENHHGGIYQACNWIYTGETTANKDAIYKGRRVPNRSLTPISQRYKCTVSELIKKGVFSDIRQIGKHRYLMPLDEEIKKRTIILSKPYPKRVKQATVNDQLTGRGGRTHPHAPNIMDVRNG